jgi:hypothetical protein
MAAGHCKDLTALQCVELGLRDPIYYFPKKEPHASRKLKEKRYRGIASVSLCDGVVQRVLHSDLNKLEISQFQEIPAKPGIGLEKGCTGNLFEQVVKKFEEHKMAYPTDISSFDMSVPAWALRADAERRVLKTNSEGTPYATAVRADVDMTADSVIIFPSGNYYTQTIPGIQKSGSYCTSSANSWVRIMVSWALGFDCIAMGDDAIEFGPPGLGPSIPELYAKYGFTVKDEPAEFNPSDGFEFCSHEFHSGDRLIPLNVVKSVYRFLHTKEYIREASEGIIHALLDHPKKEVYAAEIRRLCALKLSEVDDDSDVDQE